MSNPDIGPNFMKHLATPEVQKIIDRFPRIPVEELHALAMAGDDPVDAYLATTDMDPKRDDVVEKFKADVKGGNVQAKKLWANLKTTPEWVDKDRIKRGQEVYFRFAEVFNVLFFSSFTGVGSPDFAKILGATGYMTSPQSAFRRIIETAHWVANIMSDDDFGVGSKGWLATLRVRFLHAAVRRRLEASVAQPDEHVKRLVDGVVRGTAIGISEIIERFRPAFIFSQNPDKIKARIDYWSPFFFKMLSAGARVVTGDDFCDFVGLPKRREIPMFHKVLTKVGFTGMVIATKTIRIVPLVQKISVKGRKFAYIRIFTWMLGDKPKFALKHAPTTEREREVRAQLQQRENNKRRAITAAAETEE
ncbi:hypothetical protein M427DRAFT_41294 [Gonapodya prolifera JEL478]|uniref:Uncharacterized protein n=1 Tax=Gonapodya prolifera (strain JEL478) TaxID=1344416 RepID=A0A139AVP3_GONPJ|nr:hypothetical protein M427DRAFT_41294 [Gonapodya prolifera JEL478]|eukprot:KXS20545.1 hypothetical protein M427DRAFT_41294 [Gonapodya prolifera JEL478]